MQMTLSFFLAEAVALLSLGLGAARAAVYDFTTIQYPGAAITTPYSINNASDMLA